VAEVTHKHAGGRDRAYLGQADMLDFMNQAIINFTFINPGKVNRVKIPPRPFQAFIQTWEKHFLFSYLLNTPIRLPFTGFLILPSKAIKSILSVDFIKLTQLRCDFKPGQTDTNSKYPAIVLKV